MYKPSPPRRGMVHDTRSPAEQGELISWVRPPHEEPFAIVRFNWNRLTRVPMRYVRFHGAALTVAQQAELDKRGWTLAKLKRVAKGNGVTVEQAAEALCE